MNHRFRRSSIAEPDRRIPLLSITFLAILFLPCLPPVFGAHGKCWEERSTFLRWEIARILTLPTVRTPLDSVVHRTRCEPDYSIESITFASEPGSRVTALLYLPRNATHPVPAVILACGHGGSKSCFYAQYAGQLYSKGGFACLVVDTIGEEEREAEGRLGARGHDLYKIGDKVPQYVHTVIKRMILGKIVWDLIRGIDYLETRAEIEKSRIGIVGYSLGGTSAGCVAVLDKRIRAAILCGWVFSARYGEVGKYCTRMAYSAFNRILLHEEMTALLAPHAATLFFCGTEDDVIDPQEHGAAVVRDLQRNIEGAQSILHAAGVSGAIEAELVPGAGHRPFFLSRRAVLWMQEHLVNPRDRRPVPEAVIPFGKWVDSQGKQIEKLYNTERNERGLEAVDCGAVLFDPRELACFPDSVKPDPIYTMEGWIQSATQAAKEQHLPSHLRRWLIEPQIWIRDSTEPILRLGEKGAFDEMHLFAPAVAWERDQYTMLYCGSGGKVEERVFRLGLATAKDGIHFLKFPSSPVLEFQDSTQSILTPSFLRGENGQVILENGSLRLWFSTADLTDATPLYTLRSSTTEDCVAWSDPSPPLLDHVYAPTVIRDRDHYRLWYTDVRSEPWTIRHAYSRDGLTWTVTEGPVLVLDQEWERGRLFYPTVVQVGGVYLMWYGSYWSGHEQKTALGFAVSEDGVIWHKHPQNPVFQPAPDRFWESHYTTSQSIMRFPDGFWRIWYATRPAPPHRNKYFAIGTAHWDGLAE